MNIIIISSIMYIYVFCFLGKVVALYSRFDVIVSKRYFYVMAYSNITTAITLLTLKHISV